MEQKKFKNKKSLGQHFLTQPKIAMDVIDAADVAGDDIVIEIGPGKGILTEKLLIFGAKVVAIEKDRELIKILEEKFEKEIKNGRLEILERDARDFDPGVMSFYELSYKVVANIPYYITGELIRKFLETDTQPELIAFMVQKEVAERIVARNGRESILSISVKAYGKPRITKRVSAGSFFPKPKVDSAILVIEDISKKFFDSFTEEEFFKIVHAGFGSKRKQLKNNLKKIFGDLAEKKLIQTKIQPDSRAENLTLLEWSRLSKLKS